MEVTEKFHQNYLPRPASRCKNEALTLVLDVFFDVVAHPRRLKLQFSGYFVDSSYGCEVLPSVGTKSFLDDSTPGREI